MRHWCLSCCHAVVFLQTNKIQYSTIISETCLYMHFLYSHLWPASQTIFCPFLASAAVMLPDGSSLAENPMLHLRLLGPCLAKTLLLFLTMVNCNLWPTLMSNCRFVLFLSFVWLPLFSLGIKTNVLCCPSFEQLGGPLSALAHFWICSAFDLRTCMFYVLVQTTTVMLHDHDLVIR